MKERTMTDYGEAVEETQAALTRAHNALDDIAADTRDLLAELVAASCFLLEAIGEAKLTDTAVAHLRAGHTVVEYWQTDTAGYLTLTAEGDIDIYDIKSGDASETEEVRCLTCDTVLKIDSSIP